MSSGTFFRRLRDLLPPPPLVVATVAAINADGSSTLTLPGGGTLTARGTSVGVGDNAFVRNGVVEGPAPTLTELTIEI